MSLRELHFLYQSGREITLKDSQSNGYKFPSYCHGINEGIITKSLLFFWKVPLLKVSEELLHFAFMVCLTLARLESFKVTPGNTRSYQCVGNPQDLLLPTQLPRSPLSRHKRKTPRVDITNHGTCKCFNNKTQPVETVPIIKYSE